MMSVTTMPHHSVTVYTDASLTDDRWHLLTGTYEGRRLCLYVDEALCNFVQANGNVTTDDSIVIIGDSHAWSGSQGDFGRKGLIDDVRIYSYALSAEEVKMLYDGKEPPREKTSDD